jgi:hypothetical protein
MKYIKFCNNLIKLGRISFLNLNEMKFFKTTKDGNLHIID